MPIMLATSSPTAVKYTAIRWFRTIPSIPFTKVPIQRFLRCLRCLVLGMGMKLYRMGIISRESTKIPRMFREATIPNSVSSLLSVMMKVANPEAVVTLVIRVALPMREMTRCRESA